MDDYDLASGPALGDKTPHDLTRSRTVGTSVQRCVSCGAVRHNAGDAVTSHEGWCEIPGEWHSLTHKYELIGATQ